MSDRPEVGAGCSAWVGGWVGSHVAVLWAWLMRREDEGCTLGPHLCICSFMKNGVPRPDGCMHACVCAALPNNHMPPRTCARSMAAVTATFAWVWLILSPWWPSWMLLGSSTP